MRNILSLFRRRPLGPLRTELRNLEKRFREDEQKLQDASDYFWINGGICCPGCGVPGYLDLQQKQERRLRRMQGIKEKLAKN